MPRTGEAEEGLAGPTILSLSQRDSLSGRQGHKAARQAFSRADAGGAVWLGISRHALGSDPHFCIVLKVHKQILT